MNDFFAMLELLPVQATYAYGMTQILPMRHKKLFWVVELTLWPLAQLFPPNAVGFVVGVVAMVVSWFVLPCMLFNTKPALKLLVVFAARACDMTAAAGDTLAATGDATASMSLIFGAVVCLTVIAAGIARRKTQR